MLRYSQRPFSWGAGIAGMQRLSHTALLEVEFAQLSDRGCVRENNEDYLGSSVPITPAQARTHGWLFALADGVGGQEQGQVAARVAVEKLLAAKDLPKSITEALEAKYVKADFKKAEEITKGQDLTYEVKLEKDGKKITVTFDPIGKVLKEEVKDKK